MVAVLSKTGIKLMPTSNFKARKLLKKKRAKIFQHKPFTIMLLDRENGDTQPIEFKEDTGYQHIGISICSKKHEYVSEQRDLLTNETERHNDQRKYRHTRRNRLRYREARFNNRKGMISKDGFTPSIRNKRDRHVDIFVMYYKVMPITKAYIEMGQFDTQLLKAIAEGKTIPRGEDYQHGEMYGYYTLREAVFTRDNYSCIICKRSVKDGAILHEHHMGYWKGDRTNRMSNLGTVCERCHTSKNHKPSGKLYGLEPKLKSMADATFMTSVRFSMFKMFKEIAPDVEFHMTYGAATKMSRHILHLKKTHTNDAYAMGEYHPKHRIHTMHYQKMRRNNRILSKFYDAKYVDIRDGSVKKGSQLSCGRTNRSIPRNSELNERVYRGKKVSRGKIVVRTRYYPIRPGDRVIYNGLPYIVNGTFDYGKRVRLDNGKSIYVSQITQVIHCGGWVKITK
ncbi:RNA-guided endonuclease IscB [Butyrivibrio sp.]|uniref:RNA-guided endonuclease IscB n=1 Tax=Butyrivibrio sp. TaxID=28121 RepID=UPI0025C70339|nr:RNA-guided endonuclease IscB [Butyrivibrio sp.]MBQ9302336.1 RRXRR domain-containing protein [Butyrivibrio sp.]